MATYDTAGYSTYDSIPGSLTYDNWGVDATLTQATRATFSSTFYAPTVGRGTVTLTPARFNNAQTFHAAVVGRGAVGLTPARFDNADAFYAPTVGRGAVALLPGLFTNSSVFYAPVVGRGAINLSPGYLVDGDTIYSPVAQYLEPRYAFPIADVSKGSWTASTGSDLFAMLDEPTANDADYIAATSATVCEIRLAPVIDPLTSIGQAVKLRARSTQGSTLIARLKQGSTTIATLNQSGVSGSWTDYSLVLSAAECNAITDYTNLRVELEAA
jgi:hypothetical protein